MTIFQYADFRNVHFTDPVFAGRIKTCMNATLQSCIERTVETGRIGAFDLKWKEGEPNKPHIFWDSDVAKVLEGMAYILALRYDPEIEKIYDNWVDRIVSAQQPDGYLNVYYTLIEPEKRWSNLADRHELYCAGHLIEAAVAGYEALGKTKFLNAMCRYADYIDSVFGKEPGKRRGWPGHEEIELALVRLFHATNQERYLKLAQYFINDRGTEPNVFSAEGKSDADLQDRQADKPVREMKKAYGHAVRAGYLYSGMADIAREFQDDSLLKACETIFDNLTQKRMYITGGIGSTFKEEKITQDYDLPNGSVMYAESCASISLAFFASRMYNQTGDGKYMDAVEKTIYNGILSGISLSGDKYLYANFLEVDDNRFTYLHEPYRQKWFSCSCCPTNFVRFIPRLGSYIYSLGDDEIVLNIPAANEAVLHLKNQDVKLKVEGNYPYSGKIRITVGSGGEFSLKLRIPGWCKKWSAVLNGAEIAENTIRRVWKTGDVIDFTLDMPVRCMRANSKVTFDLGRTALMRGPLVYALEEKDQVCPVRELIIRKDRPFTLVPATDLPEGTLAIEGDAFRETFEENALYFEKEAQYSEVRLRAIPYALWENRGETNMTVWVRVQ